MRNRKGFTLIELLIVVVIIGILAAIAIPKFANTKEKAYIASMKSDLRNLATAQEAYFSDYTSYFSGSASNVGGSVSANNSYVPSAGVTVTMTGTTGGWSAVAGHAQTTKTCTIAVGSAVASGSAEGEPKCP